MLYLAGLRSDWIDADPQASYMFFTHQRTRLEDLKWPSRGSVHETQDESGFAEETTSVGLWSRLDYSPFFSIGVKPSFFEMSRHQYIPV